MAQSTDPMTTGDDELEVLESHLVGYFHPREIAADESLTVARRRALLAHWLSDINAVAGTPGLRRSAAGVTATVAQLREALDQLDDVYDRVPAHVAAQQLSA